MVIMMPMVMHQWNDFYAQLMSYKDRKEDAMTQAGTGDRI